MTGGAAVRVPPWLPVAVPPTLPPPDQPVTVWVDTGSSGGLELRVPPEERWRVWDAGGRYCLLLGPTAPEDASAAAIIAAVRSIWGRSHADPDEHDQP
jgi:hypothetical protein